MVLAIAGAASLIAGAAAAQDAGASRWYLHLGPGAVIPNESATMTAGGAAVPGADIVIPNQVTLIGEIGYFVTPQVAVSFTGGLPPLAKISAAGSLKGYGTVGKVTYGPMALTATYHLGEPTAAWPVRPYIGVGPVYMPVFSNRDGVLTKLDVHSAWGVAGQIGVEGMITDRIGAYFDLKKAILRTDATGNLGPAPVTSHITLDPLVVSGGVAFHF
jgi:outer membrane protein